MTILEEERRIDRPHQAVPTLSPMRLLPSPRAFTLPIARSGFTLVELITVVTILVILAGVVVPRVSSAVDRSKIARGASDMKGIKKALLLLQQDLGRFPTTTGESVDPGLIDNSRVPASRISDWRGPYLEIWPENTPWGGNYDYGHGNMPEFNFDGTAGNEAAATLMDLDSATATAIDEIIDDGNTSTGLALFRAGGRYYSLYVGEGPTW